MESAEAQNDQPPCWEWWSLRSGYVIGPIGWDTNSQRREESHVFNKGTKGPVINYGESWGATSSTHKRRGGVNVIIISHAEGGAQNVLRGWEGCKKSLHPY